MKTDAFTLTVVLAIVISVITCGVIIIIARNSLTIIPSVERGKIVSKNVINANDSVIELSGGKILHILNNATLYMTLQENQSYSFNCLYNSNTKITTIQSFQNDTTA
ncbi:MAG TPA: hypothetical protein VLU95_01010 [Candidatus Acidoferrum sp.]|nr:hypothetical protein [Candidatus Acidoferrum sp.]